MLLRPWRANRGRKSCGGRKMRREKRRHEKPRVGWSGETKDDGAASRIEWQYRREGKFEAARRDARAGVSSMKLAFSQSSRIWLPFVSFVLVYRAIRGRFSRSRLQLPSLELLVKISFSPSSLVRFRQLSASHEEYERVLSRGTSARGRKRKRSSPRATVSQ